MSLFPLNIIRRFLDSLHIDSAIHSSHRNISRAQKSISLHVKSISLLHHLNKLSTRRPGVHGVYDRFFRLVIVTIPIIAALAHDLSGKSESRTSGLLCEEAGGCFPSQLGPGGQDNDICRAATLGKLSPSDTGQ